MSAGTVWYVCVVEITKESERGWGNGIKVYAAWSIPALWLPGGLISVVCFLTVNFTAFVVDL